MMFRFSITNEGQEPIYTEWADEPSQMTAPLAMIEVRANNPDAKIRVERKNAPPQKKTPSVRFKIDAGDNKTYYSKVVPESSESELYAQLKEEFPKGVITRESING